MIKKNTILILLLITFLGFVIRLSSFVGNNFPLHDGGFFYVMIQDLLSNKFVLPGYSSYNHANIPFIYPPFGLYFVGITEYITGASRLELFRIIPLLITTLTIPAFYFLAVEIIKDKRASLAATFVYSLLPKGYMWLILGGGITRSFGAFFAIIALIFVIRFVKSGRWTAAILGSLFCGFAVLSHPEWAWFLFYSIGIFVILKLITKEKSIVIRSFLLFLGTIFIILPWLLTIINRHGRLIYLPLQDSGFSRWNGIIKLLLLEWSGEILFPVFTLFSIIGIINLTKKKEWFVVFWLPLVFLLQVRAAGQRAVIPLALLAGIGITTVFFYLNSHHSKIMSRRKIAIITLGIFTYSLIGNLITVTDIAKPLQSQSIESFQWIKQEAPADSKILVISGKDWIKDNYSEWMTALTGRHSVSLVQGYEWLPGFSDRISRYHHLQYEYSKGMVDLVTWVNQNNVEIDYLILPKGNRMEISNWDSEPALHWDDAMLFPGVDKVFENESVLILDLRNVIDR